MSTFYTYYILHYSYISWVKGESVKYVPTDRIRIRAESVVAGGVDARYMGPNGGAYDVWYIGEDEAYLIDRCGAWRRCEWYNARTSVL